ncbi:MAG: uridylate kinase [Candidatus Improbicoccus pseudotrichonymphae]|uniref:Uridylate kinase n=1 Tax=Candidatus Improbicoccus pseudotrichonymphae TaxID=3033792 RepID=A0AA48HXQ7_9FIRM|nr:MAG: uridylate kinase [Candidatus Improbicoccus pseudotrichonymphae]
MLKYKKVLLKLSGEFLAGKNKLGIDPNVISSICEDISFCLKSGAEIGIVVGGGNFWRGRDNKCSDKTKSDTAGMLATLMNSLIISDKLNSIGHICTIHSSIEIKNAISCYTHEKIIKILDKNKVIIFGCGLGIPFFSTDTAAAFRAVEINADILLKGTNVDGIYEFDPKKNLDNNRIYKKISLNDIISKNISVMDASAVALCRENNMSICVFNVGRSGSIYKILNGEDVGTYAFPD